MCCVYKGLLDMSSLVEVTAGYQVVSDKQVLQHEMSSPGHSELMS